MIEMGNIAYLGMQFRFGVDHTCSYTWLSSVLFCDTYGDTTCKLIISFQFLMLNNEAVNLEIGTWNLHSCLTCGFTDSLLIPSLGMQSAHGYDFADLLKLNVILSLEFICSLL